MDPYLNNPVYHLIQIEKFFDDMTEPFTEVTHLRVGGKMSTL